MRALTEKFVRDEHGAIITAELILILTVLVLALVVGLDALAAALVGELADVAGAFGALDQSYNFRGVSAGDHASCSGSGFVDSASTFNLSTSSRSTSGGGGGGGSNSFNSFNSIAGGGGGSNLAAPQPALRAAPGPNLRSPRRLVTEEVVVDDDAMTEADERLAAEEVVVDDDASDEMTEAEERRTIEERVVALTKQLEEIQQGVGADAKANATANAKAANTKATEQLKGLKKRLADLCAELQRLEDIP